MSGRLSLVASVCASGVLSLVACGEQSAPPAASGSEAREVDAGRSWPFQQTGEPDSDMEAAQQDTSASGTSGSSGSSGPMAGTGPDPRNPGEPALLIHPAPTDPVCEGIAEPEVHFPALTSVAGRFHLFHTDGREPASALVVHVGDQDGSSFADPVTVLHGARRASLFDAGDRLLLLAARQYYAVLLESVADGAFTEEGRIAPDEPTYICEGYPPLSFFVPRSGGEPRFVAMGHDLHNSILGCIDRLFVAAQRDGSWQTPVQVGDGDVLYALEGDSRLTVVSTRGVYVSEDDGGSFTRLADGETTASRLWGSGAAWSGSRLAIVQSYSYANEYNVAVLLSDDEGDSWLTPRKLRTGRELLLSPIIAADGDFLAVAYRSGDGMTLMTSPDAGDSWSMPLELDLTAPTQIAITPSSIGWVSVGADAPEVCVSPRQP